MGHPGDKEGKLLVEEVRDEKAEQEKQNRTLPLREGMMLGINIYFLCIEEGI